jgi:hypothetical protein
MKRGRNVTTSKTLQPMVARSATAAQPRKARPVLWWAAIGALALALQVYLYTAWIWSGDATPTRTGPTPVPTFMRVNIRIHEVGGVVVMVFMIYWFIIRPWRRERRLSWDGLFLLGALSIVWQDSLLNITQYQWVANAYFTNWGSWLCRVPGWIPPEGCHFIEPPLLTLTWYSYGILLAAIFGNHIMRRVRAKWPEMGTVGVMGICFGILAVIDLLMESAYLRLGMFSYPGAIKGLTLWYGHYYQFPIYEAVFWGVAWTAMTSLRYFRNDKDQSVCERGIDNVRVGQKGKALLRALAICGALNAVYFIYSITMAFVGGSHASSWPEDVLKRSYFTQGLCGVGTNYMCPGPAVPINRADSIHLDPEGHVVIPPGTEVPPVIRHEK